MWISLRKRLVLWCDVFCYYVGKKVHLQNWFNNYLHVWYLQKSNLVTVSWLWGIFIYFILSGYSWISSHGFTWKPSSSVSQSDSGFLIDLDLPDPVTTAEIRCAGRLYASWLFIYDSLIDRRVIWPPTPALKVKQCFKSAEWYRNI